VYFCVLCVIVVPLPLGKIPFAVQLNNNDNNNDSVALVCERTIPIERPPLVGEFSANFCVYGGVA
jgi:hypothetical protein